MSKPLSELKLHPKLQVAVDRLNKRYANIIAKNLRSQNCAGVSDSPDVGECITHLDLFTESDTNRPFARLWVNDVGYKSLDNHVFVLESRLIQNERSPRDEKRTIKIKNIPKLVDEFAVPITFQERASKLLNEGHSRLYREESMADQKKRDAWRDLLDKAGISLILDLLEGKHREIPSEVNGLSQAYREAKAYYNWVRSNRTTNSNAAMQVIAFQVGERWIINIFGGGQPTEVTEYDSFEVMPEFIKSKVALLRIAPHNELLEDIGVKVEANSYFLYGKELQVLKKSNDSGEESKDSGDNTP